MSWLGIFARSIGSVISGVWNMFNSVAGLAMPVTVAVLKTNTNKSYQITCLLIMFISIVAAWLYIYRIIANAYSRIVEAISSQGTPFSAKVVALISILIQAMMVWPAIIVFSRLTYILPAATLYIYGYEETAAIFLEAIDGGNQPLIPLRLR